LTKPNTSCTIEMPASLRSDGVRDHPGMPFGFIPDLVFGFVGIPNPTRTPTFSDVIKIYTVVVIDGRAYGLPILEVASGRRRVKLNCPSGTFTLGTETISDFAVNPLTTVLGDLGKLQQQLTFILW
jgi:hypothetical protein